MFEVEMPPEAQERFAWRSQRRRREEPVEILLPPAALDALLDDIVPPDDEEGTSAKSTTQARTGEAKIDEILHSDAVAPTSFPVNSIEVLPKVCDALGDLRKLGDELRHHGDYQQIREEYCALSIVLNLERTVAPGFRPELSPKRGYGDPVYMKIYRDHVVIDLHWLYCGRQAIRLESRHADLRPMFQSDSPFPFETAWDFANKNWRRDVRVSEVLRLTNYQQVQLAVLRSDEVKGRFAGLGQNGRSGKALVTSPVANFEQRFSAWCERDPRMSKHYELYRATWMARALLGGDASVRQIGALVAMITGTSAQSDKTIRDREQNIARHILGPR